MINIKDTISFKIVPQHERYYNDNFGVYVFTTTDNIPYFNEVYRDPFIDKNDDDFENTQKEKSSILAGGMQRLVIGQTYSVEAEVVFNAKYKTYQYKPKTVIAEKPSSAEEQLRFLETVVSSRYANTLIEKYPNIVDDIIHGTDNVDFNQLNGIKEYTYGKIKEAVLENYVISDILTMLQPLGVSYKMIQKLISSEPNPALLKQQLLDNPYIMTKIKGLGFKKVDSLALKLNPDIVSSSKRAYAFISWFLWETAESNGHTWVTTDVLKDAAENNIPECMGAYNEVIEQERTMQSMLRFANERVGLKRLYSLEKNILDILKGLKRFHTDRKLDTQKAIADAERELGFLFTDEQKKTVENAVENSVVLICGKAGTGKSTILNAIVKAYRGLDVSCCALSAKAAQRIIEATGKNATTIHRLLGWKGTEFSYNASNPLPSDVVIVDEASMINSQLFYDLISAIKPGARLVICGDNRQLPPIGAGNVFSDLLSMKELFYVASLTKVMRQAELSGILSDANKIREGINPIQKPELKITTGELQDMTYMFRDSAEALNHIAIKTFLKSVEQDGIDNTIIVVPRKANCDNSTSKINKMLQDILLPSSDDRAEVTYGDKVFREGAKVIQRENNYDKNVFNGEIGYIKEIFYDYQEDQSSSNSNKTQYVKIEFSLGSTSKEIIYKKNELDQIELAYALTVHLAQGSGYKNVIVIIDTSHYILLDSCLLYTALTRAKKRGLLLAQPKAYIRCIKNNKAISRQTWLKDME